MSSVAVGRSLGLGGNVVGVHVIGEVGVAVFALEADAAFALALLGHRRERAAHRRATGLGWIVDRRRRRLGGRAPHLSGGTTGARRRPPRRSRYGAVLGLALATAHSGGRDRRQRRFFLATIGAAIRAAIATATTVAPIPTIIKPPPNRPTRRRGLRLGARVELVQVRDHFPRFRQLLEIDLSAADQIQHDLPQLGDGVAPAAAGEGLV